MRENYCDGLGNCLPVCPVDAISFVEKDERTKTLQATSNQWPLQIKLVSPNAPFFNDADLLVAADCAAFACRSFHDDYMKGKITIIGCPKLDATDYSEKLGEILRHGGIKSITVARMEVPCCGGLEYAVKAAMQNSSEFVEYDVVTISTDGRIIL